MKIQQRIIEILIKDIFGTYKSCADYFGVAEQYVGSWVRSGHVPMRYASYLSRKHGIPYYLFNYMDYLLMEDIEDKEYVAAIKAHMSPISAKHVLEAPLPDKKKIYKENDKRWM